jgi:polyribonucleotide nucleotidyltransferase
MNNPKRKKRNVEISVDTPNVDVNVSRNQNGDLNIDIDGKRIDAKIERTGEKLSIEIEIEDRKVYEFESNGKNGRLAKGHIFKISGAILKLFLKQGWGKIKR